MTAESRAAGLVPHPTAHDGVKVAEPRAASRNASAKHSRARPEGAMPRVLLTKREAAQALGMSVRHFERHVQRCLRCVHSGQLTLYPIRDIERWANEEATLGGRGAEGVR